MFLSILLTLKWYSSVSAVLDYIVYILSISTIWHIPWWIRVCYYQLLLTVLAAVDTLNIWRAGWKIDAWQVIILHNLANWVNFVFSQDIKQLTGQRTFFAWGYFWKSPKVTRQLTSLCAVTGNWRLAIVKTGNTHR